MAHLTIVIPTLGAAASLPACLGRLDGAQEIIIVEGGPPGRKRHAVGPRARYLPSPPGRGVQLRAGAAAATGEWLLFLHDDTLLGPGWLAAAERHIADAPQAAGYFRFRLRSAAWQARMVEAGVRLRGALFKLPYGDQGLLIRRDLYHRVGGYRPLPLLEDVDLVRRLGRRRLRLMQADAITSAARWERDGWLARSVRNLACLALYFAGLAPERIVRLYERRASGREEAPCRAPADLSVRS